MALKNVIKTWHLYYSKSANKINIDKCKIRIYPVGIYLLKFSNENPRTWCVICSELTKKKIHQSNLIDMKTLKNIDIALASLLLTLKRFHTFSWFFILEFWKCYHLGLPAGTDANYTISTKKGNCNMKRNVYLI